MAVLKSILQKIVPRYDIGELDFKLDIYDPYHAMVRQVVFSLISRNGINDLDDLVQETFVKAWKGINAFEKRSSIKTWLYRIAVNVVKDYWKKNNNKNNNTVELVDIAIEDKDQLENRDLIEHALGSLVSHKRTVLVLYYLEGMSIEEISIVDSIPEGTVKSRLHKARIEMETIFKKIGVEYE